MGPVASGGEAAELAGGAGGDYTSGMVSVTGPALANRTPQREAMR